MALKSPVAFHSYWGIVSVAGELPNVSGAAIQSSAVTVGDIAFVAADKKLYQCTTATVGSAVWAVLIDDPNAIHADVAGEINALTAKGTPTTADVMLLEDSAAAFAKKKSPISGMPTAFDAAAIHSDTAAEISPLTEKTAPVAADNALIEDSGAANVKKMIEVGDIVGYEVANLWQRPATSHSDDDEFDSGTIDSAWEVYNVTAAAVGSLSSGAVDAYDTTFNSGNVVRANQNPATRRSWILLQAPASGDLFTVAKPVTLATNELVMIRARMSQRLTQVNQDHTIALGLYQATGGHADRDNCVELHPSLALTSGEFAAYTLVRVGGSGSGAKQTTDVAEQGQAIEYAAFHKIGTTYHVWVGTAGGNWIYMGTQSFTGTIAYAGMTLRNNSVTSPGVMVVGIDFIRFLETDNFLL